MARILFPIKSKKRSGTSWRSLFLTASISFFVGVTTWAMYTGTYLPLTAKAQSSGGVRLSQLRQFKRFDQNFYAFFAGHFQEELIDDTTGSNSQTTTQTGTGGGSTTGGTTGGTTTTTANILAATNPNLTAYFPMDEASGHLVDKGNTKFNHFLIPQGTVQYGKPGKVGTAVRVTPGRGSFCSAESSNGQCVSRNAYDFSGSFTLGAWVKLDDPNAVSGLFRKWEAGKGSYTFAIEKNQWIGSLSHQHEDWISGYCFQETSWCATNGCTCPDGGPYYTAPRGRSFRVSGSLDLNSGWHHILIVRDASAKTYEVYKDFSIIPSEPGKTPQASGGSYTSLMQGSTYKSADPFFLGAFNGEIDEFVAFNKALSKDEIDSLKKIYPN